jgi:hypothetical protein
MYSKILGALKKFQNPKRFIFMRRHIRICQKTELKSPWTVPLIYQNR